MIRIPPSENDQRSLNKGTAFDRKPSPVGSTEGVPAGTLLQVPSTSSTGPTGPAPVVAVNNLHWYQDPGFVAAVIGAFLAISDPIIEILVSNQPLHWRPLIAGALLGVVAWLRSRSNSVIGRTVVS